MIKQFAARMAWGLSCLLATGLAHAQYELAEIPFFDSPDGAIGLGAGLRRYDDIYIGAEGGRLTEQDVVPLYLYSGRYLFSRGTAAGIHLFRNDHVELNALFSWRTEHLDPESRDEFANLNRREQSLDGGVELRLKGGWGRLNVNYLTDTLDRHEGQSAAVSYFFPLRRGRFSVFPFIGFSWYSDELADYYFGVSEEEATELLAAYSPGEARWLSLGVNTSYQLTPRWELFANLGVGSVDSAVADSPIVDTGTRAVLFAGFNASMGNLIAPGADLPPERRGEWSWRVNYGYQADGSLMTDIHHGDFTDSRFSDSTIGGITFARLFRKTQRVEMHGKFAVFRHFEADEGNGDFFSYAAYVTITGKGYRKWSNEELFRYSLGYGLSYADKVPIDEQREQLAQGEDETSRFLNYLEVQVDFPLRILFKGERALGNCYTGLTVTHRSGMWGQADMFSNVDGGANWITAHLECTLGNK